MRAGLSFVLASIALTQGLAAQGVCRPPEESSDSKLLAFFSAPIAFSPSGSTGQIAPWSVSVSLDATYIPKPSEDIRSSSYCHNKGENTELSPVFPRPRLALGLPGGLYVEASYLPPITVMDATPNLGSVALGWARAIRGNVGATGSTWLTLRGHATFGNVKGPITCSDDALQQSDPDGICFGTEESEDTYKPQMVGGEAMLSFAPGERFTAYVGGGYTSLKPRFQVGFQPTNGTFDDTRVEVDLDRVSAFLGGRYRVGGRTALTGELYSVPKDATTFRFGVSYDLRTAPTSR